MGTAGKAAYYRIEFRPQAGQGRVLLALPDPAPEVAVVAVEGSEPLGEAPEGGLDVVTVSCSREDEARWRQELARGVEAGCCAPGGAASESALAVKVEDVHVWWWPGRAAILGPAPRIVAALAAVAEFDLYEAEVRKLEAETALAWPKAQDDTRLAYDVVAADLAGHQELGRRTVGVFHRRIRHARIGPHLARPAADLPPLARRLGEALREESDVADRLESLDEKIEVYEYIYELASQRMGEYRNARREMFLEVLIIAILVIETLATFLDGFIMWWNAPD